MSGYLGLDFSGGDISGMLWHRSTGALHSIASPIAGLSTPAHITSEKSPEGHNWTVAPWTLRGLQLAIPDGRSPQLRYTHHHTVDLATVRSRLTSPFVALQNRLAQSMPKEEGLEGVILTMPPQRFDAYCFNLREVVLQAGLVQSPDQIFFVEAAIAPLLAWLRSPTLPPSGQPQASAPGRTIVLHTHAAATDLGMLDLSPGWESQPGSTRYFPSFAYGEHAIAQDMLGQMFYSALDHPDLSVTELPLPGQPDSIIRDRLQQSLQSTDLGQNLLRLATQLQATFSQGGTLEFQLQGETRTLVPDDFHRAVLVHYLRRLHQELNAALGHMDWDAGAIQQVICSGRLAEMAAIAQWLRRKFPQAHVICLAQDRPETSLAAGLACLPLYPALLDATRHRYGNLFLFRELLRLLPTTSVSWARVLQVLNQNGINTDLCQRSLLGLLEGQLPGGFVATPADAALLTTDSEFLISSPLFRKLDTQYQMDTEVRDRCQAHLTAILTQTQQTLVDPLSLLSLQDV